MTLERYIIRFTETPQGSGISGYHCVGSPKDNKDIDYAAVMSKRALEAVERRYHKINKSLAKRGVQGRYRWEVMRCTLEILEDSKSSLSITKISDTEYSVEFKK